MSASSSSALPNASMLCGDEVPGVVIDTGSSFCKFGSAGQDAPHHVFRSDTATYLDNNKNVNNSNTEVTDMDVEDTSNTTIKDLHPAHRIVCGDMPLRNIVPNVTINRTTTFNEKDGLDIIDWERVESIFDYGLNCLMKVDTKIYPLMLTESIFKTLKDKTKLLELLFENFESPGIYIGKDAMLSSFCAGRATSLVVDLGASGTTITPIIDGYSLTNSTVRSNRGGDWLDIQLSAALTTAGHNIRPWFDAGDRQGKLTDISPSLYKLHQNDVIREVKSWMCFVPRDRNIIADGDRAAFIKALRIPQFELPDKTMVSATEGICLLPEQFVMPSGKTMIERLPLPQQQELLLPPHASENMVINSNTDSLQELILTSLAKCDIDVRRDLLNNIVLVGGGALIDGLSNRLTSELSLLLPSTMKPKVISMIDIERRFAPWIGGSILSICGSFQQLWISKKEFDDYGPNLIAKRFNK